MFERVMEWLEDDDIEGDHAFDISSIRVSVAALFYHVIAVDGDVSECEKNRLAEILTDNYNLSEEQLLKLTQQARTMQQETAGVFPFTVILNRELNELERHSIFSQLQALAMADGEVHDEEREFLTHVRSLLKLS